MGRSKSVLAVAVCAALCGSVGVGAAFAGEVNGSETNPKFQFSQGRSICKFSGLNDNPDSTDPEDPGGRVQSYGYSVVRAGAKAFAPSPGDACNPNAEFEE
jgi:hypothetical protein